MVGPSIYRQQDLGTPHQTLRTGLTACDLLQAGPLLCRECDVEGNRYARLSLVSKLHPDANPFAPQWKSYFKERAFYKKFGIHRHEAGIKTS